MNKKQLLFKTLSMAVFAAVMLFNTSEVSAQVKIGSNPTVINAANNLEVEASTTGRKTSVDKVTGQVTIKDGTEGDGKILTSDVNGASRWDSGTSAFRVTSGSQIITAPVGVINAFYNVDFNAKVFDQDGIFTLANDRLTVTKAGTILLSGSIVVINSVYTGASIALFKNGVFVINSGGAFGAGEQIPVSISLVDTSVVGDYYELRVNTNIGSATVLNGNFSGTRIR